MNRKDVSPKELGRRHALEDVMEREKRPHSIDAHPDYLKSYKEHMQKHWGSGKGNPNGDTK